MLRNMPRAKDCTHRWLLESPHGPPTVSGTCKLCGATRSFKASFDEKDSKGAARARGGAANARRARQRRESESL